MVAVLGDNALFNAVDYYGFGVLISAGKALLIHADNIYDIAVHFVPRSYGAFRSGGEIAVHGIVGVKYKGRIAALKSFAVYRIDGWRNKHCKIFGKSNVAESALTDCLDAGGNFYFRNS